MRWKTSTTTTLSVWDVYYGTSFFLIVQYNIKHTLYIRTHEKEKRIEKRQHRYLRITWVIPENNMVLVDTIILHNAKVDEFLVSIRQKREYVNQKGCLAIISTVPFHFFEKWRKILLFLKILETFLGFVPILFLLLSLLVTSAFRALIFTIRHNRFWDVETRSNLID